MVSALWENIFRRNSTDVVRGTLSRNLLFRELSRGELRFVMDIVHVREYRPGEKVFSQGEVGVGMYIIVKGAVDILVEDLSSPHDGRKKDIHIARLSKDDFFGELSLIEDNGRRNASAVAHEDTQLIGFFKPDLMEILERNPHIGAKVVYRLAEVLGQRLIKTTENIAELRKEIQKLTEKGETV